MPRTRAGLRSVEQQEESDLAASIPLPQTPIKGRAPLGEIAGNNNEVTKSSEEQGAPPKKGARKGKKGNTAKKATKPTKEKAEEVRVEVLEDENKSIHSSAAGEACQDLLKDGAQSTHEVVVDDQPQTPPSAAANTARRQLSPKPTTLHFDSDAQKSDNMATPANCEAKEDSFVAKIESRTPMKMAGDEGMDTPPNEESNKDDSFMEQIKTRTPSKRISRIEDSVEALDALEEEIEVAGGLIPANVDRLQSSVKAKKQEKSQPASLGKKSGGSVRMKKSTGSQKRIGTGRPSTAVGPATSSPSVGATNTRARPSRSLSQSKADIPTQAPGSTRSVGQSKRQATLKTRTSSVHKAPFQPIKSKKPPTRANFELPGDAVARKLKEQREERLKREEEETPKPRIFKARPVRLSHAPEVKLTAATKARLSMAKGESIDRNRSSNGFGKAKPVARRGPMATASPDKRRSTLSVAERSAGARASGSLRLTRGPSLNASATVSAPSLLGANRPAPTAEESAHQKLKGKEVFSRTRVEIMEREKAKKEKEDAARKARAEAAERGRIASRQWAERQKARKLEAGSGKGA